jgi:hypothetical protein
MQIPTKKPHVRKITVLCFLIGISLLLYVAGGEEKVLSSCIEISVSQISRYKQTSSYE